MSLTLLASKDLGAYGTIIDGEYYADATCTGLPRHQSAGYFKQDTYNDGSDDILVMQEFKGLRAYGDNELSTYERFFFPKESAAGLHAREFKWQKRRPLTFLNEQ